MHAILVSVGTDGDILPYVGLGAALRSRGHRVTLTASEHYGALARAHDLEFQALVSRAENEELFGHPDFWKPLKTAPLSARWGVRFICRQYELLSGLVTREAVLVASPGVFAASIVHERLGVPWTNLILQPGLIPSSIAPPMMPMFTFLSRAPRPVWRVFWRALDAVGDILVGSELNRVRASLGLKPMRRIFQNWLSKQQVIGMFPEWYGQPQADWPSQMRLVGFPLCDGVSAEPLPPGLLEFCHAGEPPVAFTFGTGMRHSAKLFRAALGACEILGVRGIFISRYRDQMPEPLPRCVLHCAFAPFQKLFPLCTAVVHHGGIGTVAAAMAAGTPQLIRPICFDQIDNGARTRRLGVGDYLRSGRCRGGQLAAALAGVMTEPTRARCRQLQTRLTTVDACRTSAELVEALASDWAAASSL